MECVNVWTENIAGKRENVGNQHILFFCTKLLQSFSPKWHQSRQYVVKGQMIALRKKEHLTPTINCFISSVLKNCLIRINQSYLNPFQNDKF